MDINEVKQFIESNKDNEEVKNYIGGFITSDRVESFLGNDDGKKLLQPKLDSYFTKGLETWKSNNLEKLIDEEIKKRFPAKDVKDIELEKVKAELEKIKVDALRKELTNKALLVADEKKLPKDLVEYFIGNDEETTNKNLEALESVFSKHIEALVQERLKGSGYTPPKGGEEGKISMEDLSNMSIDEINKLWDKVAK
ncbi:DUF4355 domain-containing protein [Tissierella sp.]|uniref:DUF4355 domain-containing protein n=1 Tax=Tissierella sp. TaxID=41274 RepID=UPI0028B07E11|nr:DUF4355 domain-containing protein [Tissierella sp.]